MAPNLPPRATALLLALAAGLLLLRLGAVPLLGPDEPRYARVAIEMQRAHEWVTPTLSGTPWLEKPPLYYWLAGLAYRVLGENETAARLPALAAAVALVGLTAFVGARLLGVAAGLHAGFILSTSVLWFAYGRAASMDMLLSACVTAAIGLLALRLFDAVGSWAVPAAGAAMGLATLAKGPLGVLLPGLVLVGFAAFARDLRPLRLALNPLSIVAFLAVAAPWYGAILADQGRHFVDVFLLNHNVARFTSTVHNHPGPFVYYLPVLLMGFFPWSAFLLPALAGTKPRRERLDLFLVLWLVLPLAFFSLAGSKLPGYVLPCLAPLALLLGRAAARFAAHEDEDLPSWTGRRATAFVGLGLAALLALAPIALARIGEPAWKSVVPVGVWAVLVALAAARRIDTDPAGALRLLRVGGAGFLLLVTAAAPAILARRESGRALFLPAQGREVLAFGAWRTAWMAGYFYNDGRVREVADVTEIQAATASGPALVLCGPGERRRLESDFQAIVLAEGPRGNALLRVSRR
ncbi:MAG TPA: glycosyltransferase family 39 protein [Vicinamibacteria bacterium]|nr:glycosyltransferase family 39 protein [Vicinamibacteria bacterium]